MARDEPGPYSHEHQTQGFALVPEEISASDGSQQGESAAWLEKNLGYTELQLGIPYGRGRMGELRRRRVRSCGTCGNRRNHHLREPSPTVLDEPPLRCRPGENTDPSSGTKTLMSLAWARALLELAVERGQPHPGFLMVDGISKNMTPADQTASPDPDIRADIIEKVYAHVAAWTAGAGRDAQVVFVDNRPPRRAAYVRNRWYFANPHTHSQKRGWVVVG